VYVVARVDDLRSDIRTLAAYQQEQAAYQRQQEAQQRKLIRIILKNQLRPTSSSVSTKRKDKHRETATEYYYGVGASQKIRLACMVTGDTCAVKDLKAGHIYRQEWGAGLLVSEGDFMLGSCSLFHQAGNQVGKPRMVQHLVFGAAEGNGQKNV